MEEVVAEIVCVPEFELEGVPDLEAEIDCVALIEEVPVRLVVEVAVFVTETVAVRVGVKDPVAVAETVAVRVVVTDAVPE